MMGPLTDSKSSSPGTLRSSVSRDGSALLIGLFCLSGMSALVFENAWQKMMVLSFGASAPATASILTSFFLGIALGSRIGGKLSSRFHSGIHFYCAAELWIAVFGLAVPTFLAVAGDSYALLFKAFDPTAEGMLLPRFLLSVAVVLPATIGMGATIPAMNRVLVDRGYGVGRGISLAYGVNTAGGVLGCLLAGFLLVPKIGIQKSLIAAAAVNCGIVISVVLSDLRSWGARGDQLPAAATRPATGSHLSTRSRRVLAAAYFGSGFVALGFEVVWFRILGIYTTSSATTFSVGLGTYLLGFGFGSFLLYPVLARRLTSMRIFVAANWGAVGSVLIMLPLIYRFPHIIQGALSGPASRGLVITDLRLTAVEALFSFVLMFLPSLFFGMSYPAVCESLIESPEETGPSSGLYYFLGNLGSMLGVLLAGLIMVPFLGLTVAVTCLCLIAAGLGFLPLFLEERGAVRGGSVWFSAGGVLIAASLLFGAYGHPFYRHGTLRRSGDLWEEVSDRQTVLLRYKSGPSATVWVSEEGDRAAGLSSRRLYIDGEPVAGTNVTGKVDSKVLAHLPLLLHPSPQRALTVGFGSGGTSWSMTLHDVDVDCVEIEPEVVKSAGHFNSLNHGVLSLDNFRVIVNDARDFLALTQKRYDVISTDVTNLQYKQNANLYTREYFRLVKERLTAAGVACVWAPMAGVASRDFKILLKTFSEVFPHSSVWYMNHVLSNYVILIGTPEALAIDMGRISEGFESEGIAADLAEIGIIEPEQLPSFLLLDEEGARRYAGKVPLHTDDLPLLEYSSPSTYYQLSDFFARNLLEVSGYRSGSLDKYVTGATTLDWRLLGKYQQRASLRLQVIPLFFLDEKFRSKQIAEGAAEEVIANIESALRAANELVSTHGKGPHDLEMYQFFLQRLSEVRAWFKSPVSQPLAGKVEEDFEVNPRLTILPRVGPYPPEAGGSALSAWASSMDSFLKSSGLRGGAGRNGSRGLVLRSVEGIKSSGYFTQLAVRPSGTYTVHFWAASSMGEEGEGGVGLLQFDRFNPSPWQASRSFLSQHLIKGENLLRLGGLSEWGKYEYTFTALPDARMAHLVFYREGDAGGGSIVFDDVVVEAVTREMK